MTRLGSKLPFREAAEEVWYSHRVRVNEASLRQITHRHGAAAEALIRQEVETLERDAPDASANPQNLLISVDGAFVQLTSGEWREVKSLAVGEFSTEWEPGTWNSRVKTSQLSYFSRSYPAREFERYALAELHRRGVENARRVVAVNDGAEWIQGFLDYHCPKATRVIDFAHAAGYVAQAGKAVWQEESQTFQDWFTSACHGLKHNPPQETIANLHLIIPKAKSDTQASLIDGAIFYLQSRLHMLDYAHFRHCGYPIGSGCVESGHKVVVQQRMKGAGMRWAEHHLDPMLSLRNLVCNGTWEAGWRQIVLYQQEQQLVKRIRAADDRLSRNSSPPPEPIAFSSLEPCNLLPDVKTTNQTVEKDLLGSSRPAPDHPWRNNIWPTNESWRWN